MIKGNGMSLNENNVLPVSYEGEHAYNIHICEDYSQLKAVIAPLNLDGRKVCIVTDDHIAPHYLKKVEAIVKECANKVVNVVLKAGEEYKNLDSIATIYEKLIVEHFDRKDTLIALGGGVIGDMTGFAAATYLRGISFIQMPTTLLSMVDSSIGGKTGVDYKAYKNMVGAFYMPKAVFINFETLNTLPDREFYSGFGEILKHGLIKDGAYFDELLANAGLLLNRDAGALTNAVYKSCCIKREVVQNDPKEQGERALLNFGHTIGHAVEKLMNFEMLHGECVGIGMVAATYLSMERGNITKEDFDRILAALKEFHLVDGIRSIKEHMNAEDILLTTKSDKKMDGNTIRFILLNKPGEAYIDTTVSEEEVLKASKFILSF
ncbi:MAG: 3-dehydroquinate synthase [Lachnospiraceae bacterium]|nr:3-dehydroquinate synthase [Lachnospiraceae bacterium]